MRTMLTIGDCGTYELTPVNKRLARKRERETGNESVLHLSGSTSTMVTRSEKATNIFSSKPQKRKVNKMQTQHTTVVARWYIIDGGQQCRELVALPSGMYIVAENGHISDARAKLTADEAQELYDQAAYHIGARPINRAEGK